MTIRKPPAGQDLTDARFLIEEFDMPAEKAADLLAQPGPPHDALAASARRAERAGDPLADAPTPLASPTDQGGDSDEESLKPVIHTRNDRAGGG